MNRKLEDYNHRFNDLANLLSSQDDSSILQDKIASLIQPLGAAAATSTAYTSVRDRSSRESGRSNTKSTEQHVKILKNIKSELDNF